MHTPLVLLIVLLTACTCLSRAGDDSCDSLASLRWMLGDWVSSDGGNVTVESWVEVSDQTFEGRGETRRGSTDELLNTESLRVMVMGGGVFYVAKVEHNEMPIPFKLVDCAQHAAIFENEGHDFPKKLEYHLIGSDSLVVRVSDGGEKGFQMRFERVK